MINTNILQRVLLIQFEEGPGTGFTLEIDGEQFIVTTNHLVSGISSHDTIQIFHECEWKDFDVEPLVSDREDFDVAVLKFDLGSLTPNHEIVLDSKPILSEDVYFLRFPDGLKMDMDDINNGFPLPLVKKGIIAGLFPEKDTILIDGYNTPGFSGGPVVTIDHGGKTIRLIAMISGFLSAKGSDENYGIFKAITLNSIVKEIKKSNTEN